jgi:P-type Cu2+ transporter
VFEYLINNHWINNARYGFCFTPTNFTDFYVNAEADSYLSFLDKRTKTAELQKSTIENYAAKWLKYFVPTVFALATIAFIAISFFISPVSAINSAISILVSACPCTLGLITPLAMKTGIAKGADYGVSYKSGKSIEAASNIDTVIFDLNGTLTTGVPTSGSRTNKKRFPG